MTERKKAALSGQPKPTPVTPEEASGQHRGKWILMEVTAYDDHFVPRAGIVRLASKSRRRITEESLRLRDAEAANGRGHDYLVYHATPDVNSPVGWAMDIADRVVAARGKRAGFLG